MVDVRFTLALKTTNPNNGSAGFSRAATFAKARRRKAQRQVAGAMTRVMVGPSPRWPLVITLTRVAPSDGLDPHDGLGAALKGVIDGVADGLGLRDDRDARVTWVLGQRRGHKGAYAVEVHIEPRPEPVTPAQ